MENTLTATDFTGIDLTGLAHQPNGIRVKKQ